MGMMANKAEGITHIECWVHIHRKFNEEIPKNASSKRFQCEIGKNYCDQLFRLEKERAYLSPKARLEKKLFQF